MVQEKDLRIRETLKLMSLSVPTYGMSFFLFQSCFAIPSAVIIMGPNFNRPLFFGQEDTMSKSI